jgi:HAD superfamily hydrolase (TIGR01509 family)
LTIPQRYGIIFISKLIWEDKKEMKSSLKRSSIKGIIYDLDDLMVNSDPLHNEAWEALLNGLGHSLNDIPQEMKTKFIGRRAIDFMRAMIQELKLKGSEEELYKKKTQIFLSLVKEKLEPLPGLFRSIKLFKENGFKLAIASSGARQYIDLVVSKLALQGIFDVIISGDEVKVGKPNPEICIVTCRRLSLRPEECLVLEDATSGIESAKRAGCRCIAVKNRNTPPQELSKADCVVNALEEVSLEIIKSFHT